LSCHSKIYCVTCSQLYLIFSGYLVWLAFVYLWWWRWMWKGLSSIWFRGCFETGAICLIDKIFLECLYNRWQRCFPSERSSKYEKTYGQCLELFTSLRQCGSFCLSMVTIAIVCAFSCDIFFLCLLLMKCCSFLVFSDFDVKGCSWKWNFICRWTQFESAFFFN
jgi:hypothetical protein